MVAETVDPLPVAVTVLGPSGTDALQFSRNEICS
jgi:hypothetical protein